METTRTTESAHTTESTRTSRTKLKLWAIPLGALALGAVALGIFSLATPAGANNPTGTRVLECSSGVVTNGDISMSAATATRVPAAQLPSTIPGDCSLR